MEIYNSISLCIEIKYIYTVEKYSTFEFSICSNGFSGKYNFCISIDRIKGYINQLKDMMIKESINVKIEDYDSDSYLFVGKDGNAVCIKGQIGGSYNDNYLVFKNRADQTILYLLCDGLTQGIL